MIVKILISVRLKEVYVYSVLPVLPLLLEKGDRSKMITATYLACATYLRLVPS